ncbi:MAG: dihydrolipoyl dehydrogenase family protein [Acidimicrobiales bacterium]
MTTSVDVVVLGLGPGGEAAAKSLAEAGLEVVGIEARLVGGECPYWGCVPSKMLLRAAAALQEARRVDQLSGQAAVTPDFSRVARRIRTEATDGWDDRIAVERLALAGVKVVKARGRLLGNCSVSAAGEVFEARRGVLLNTGTEPWAPPIDGLAEAGYWTNREALESEVAPESMVVLGGGAVGVELAQAFARFGTAVTVVESADRLLQGEEPEASALLAEVLGHEGVMLYLGASVSGVRARGDNSVVSLEGVGELEARRLLVATGRRPDLGALGIASIGLDETASSIPVDARMRAADGLWAIGDVTGVGPFTHISMYQSAIAVRDILGQDGPVADYRALPRVTFTEPEIGSVGLTEDLARQRGVDVVASSSDLAASSRGWIHGPGGKGLFKLVADASRHVLVGATSVGPAGGETLGALTLAVHLELDLEVLGEVIYPYPTFQRGIQDALGALKEALENAT